MLANTLQHWTDHLKQNLARIRDVILLNFKKHMSNVNITEAEKIAAEVDDAMPMRNE